MQTHDETNNYVRPVDVTNDPVDRRTYEDEGVVYDPEQGRPVPINQEKVEIPREDMPTAPLVDTEIGEELDVDNTKSGDGSDRTISEVIDDASQNKADDTNITPEDQERREVEQEARAEQNEVNQNEVKDSGYDNATVEETSKLYQDGYFSKDWRAGDTVADEVGGNAAASNADNVNTGAAGGTGAGGNVDVGIGVETGTGNINDGISASNDVGADTNIGNNDTGDVDGIAEAGGNDTSSANSGAESDDNDNDSVNDGAESGGNDDTGGDDASAESGGNDDTSDDDTGAESGGNDDAGGDGDSGGGDDGGGDDGGDSGGDDSGGDDGDA